MKKHQLGNKAQMTTSAILAMKHLNGYEDVIKEARAISHLLNNPDVDAQEYLSSVFTGEFAQSFISRILTNIQEWKVWRADLDLNVPLQCHRFVDSTLRQIRMLDTNHDRLKGSLNMSAWTAAHVLYNLVGGVLDNRDNALQTRVYDFQNEWKPVDETEITRRETILMTVALLQSGTPISAIDYTMQIGVGFGSDTRFDILNRKVAEIHAYCLLAGIDLRIASDRKKFVETLTPEVREVWHRFHYCLDKPYTEENPRSGKMRSLPNMECYEMPGIFQLLVLGRLETNKTGMNWYDINHGFLEGKLEII